MLPRGLCRLLAVAGALVLALLVGPVLAGHGHAGGAGQVDWSCGKCALAGAAVMAGEPLDLLAGLAACDTVPAAGSSRTAGPLGLAVTPSRGPPALAS